MIIVDLRSAPPETLRRLAACAVWYMGPALYSDIRKGAVTIDRIEVFAQTPHAVEVIVDRFIPEHFVIGKEGDDRLWLTLSDMRLDGMPEQPVRSAT